MHTTGVDFVAVLIVLALGLPAVSPAASGSPALREVPEITLENLSPPYKDYEYFKDHENHLFRHHAKSFDLTNCWWLAEASTLVYAGEPFVRTRFQKAGLPQVRFFSGSSTQCYVAANARFAVVAFRGSEIWKREGTLDLKKITADLLVNVDVRLTDWDRGGRVHAGFHRALEEIWPALENHIRALAAGGRTLWFTGHSLGGALAVLAADRYGNGGRLYTFGAPRVGDAEFADRFGVTAYRVVNHRDIVSRVPPEGIYRHVGEPRHIDKNGKLHGLEPRLLEETSEGGTSTAGSGSSSGWIPEPMQDHVPLRYTIHLWNNMVAN